MCIVNHKSLVYYGYHNTARVFMQDGVNFHKLLNLNIKESFVDIFSYLNNILRQQRVTF